MKEDDIRIKKNMNKIILLSLILLPPLILFFTIYLDLTITSGNIPQNKIMIYTKVTRKSFTLFLLMFSFLECMLFILLIYLKEKGRITKKVSEYVVTEKIQIPRPAGQKQHGSSWFTESNEFKNIFDYILIDKSNFIVKKLLKGLKVSDEEFEKYKNKSGGILLGKSKKENVDEIYYVGDDMHSIVIGATGAGKSRTVVLQTIGVQAFAGENMIVSDPKGELFLYTKDFLNNLGYEVITIDFYEPQKSDKYNFLQNVIDFVNADNIPKAVESAWDLTATLVGESKGEPIWQNGESAIICGSILSIVYDNKKNPEYQNLTNVYAFISEMTKEKEGEQVPLDLYVEQLSENHPAKQIFAVANVAPNKTRGSFYTSALGTLKLFTNPMIYNMTNETSFNKNEVNKRRAIFIILPDEKKTYYPLASLFVANTYETLVGKARENGNRLPIRTNYNLDEFGNYAPIKDFDTKITVGRGYGIRFNLFLQAYDQLESVYSKEISGTVRGNCETIIYLKTINLDTAKELSEQLGNYTTTTITGSDKKNINVQLQSRNLLTHDEIMKIERPHTLVKKYLDNCIFYAPDLTKYLFNKLYGLGNKEHNILVIKERQSSRKLNEIEAIKYSGIWKNYNGELATEIINDISSIFQESDNKDTGDEEDEEYNKHWENKTDEK